MNTLKLFLRTDQKNKDGSHSVCIRLTMKRRKKDVSLRIYVKPSDWMFSKNLVKKSDPKHLRKNKLIKKYSNKAESIVDECFFNDEQLTFDDFKNKLLNKEYSDASFIEFVNDELAIKNYSAETLKTYLTQITKLQRFKKKLAFSEINKSFILGYKDFMINKLGNKSNTANKSLSMLKTFVNWAIEKNLIKDNPFNNIKITKGKGKREHLNIAELRKLENLYLDNDLGYRQLNVLRYFLFVCYTGLRYTDIKHLKYSHIKKRLFRDGEIDFIDLKMHKTGLDVSIPIIEKAKKLMPKKVARDHLVFRVLSNQKTNQYLKEVIKVAGIEKNITFHSARHTLATTGLEMGIPIEVVSKILGHTEIKMTQIYAKVNDGLKYREMMKLDQKAG